MTLPPRREWRNLYCLLTEQERCQLYRQARRRVLLRQFYLPTPLAFALDYTGFVFALLIILTVDLPANFVITDHPGILPAILGAAMALAFVADLVARRRLA